MGATHWKAWHLCKSTFAKGRYGIVGQVMNIHIQNCSKWLINLHRRQNGGDDWVNRQTRVRYFLANFMNINEVWRQHPRMRVHCLFRHEAEVNSELICSCWIFYRLIYPYSDEFISHVASKHAVWHLYFCDITIIAWKNPGFARKWRSNIYRIFPIGGHRAVM